MSSSQAPRRATLTTDLTAAAAQLRSGGVVAAATETFFGLLVDATQSAAIDRLLALKPRGADKGLPLILPSAAHWSALTPEIPAAALTLVQKFWPGPLSVALPAVAALDSRIALEGSVAVRVPSPCTAGELARLVGRPLTATSANHPGEAPATRAAQVLRSFECSAPELLVVDGESPGGLPSTVIRFEQGAWHVARAGAVALDAIVKLLGEPGPAPRA